MISWILRILLAGAGLGVSLVAWEAFLRFQETPTIREFPDINRPDPNLGHSGRPLATAEESLTVNGRLIYRAQIKLDRWGFREIEGQPEASPRCVLILGDSLPFGLGVNAEYTTASLLQRSLGPKVRVVNLAYPAYGPHQTLRRLELGLERDILRGCVRTKAFYFTQLDQVRRVAGRQTFALSAPKYELVGNDVRYVGPTYPEWLFRLYYTYVEKYRIGAKLAAFFVGQHRDFTPKEVATYQAILTKIQQILSARYGSELTLVLFVYGKEMRKLVQEQLTPPGMPWLSFEGFALKKTSQEQILPTYYLGDFVHLNREGHALLARSLLEEELRGWKRDEWKAR